MIPILRITCHRNYAHTTKRFIISTVSVRPVCLSKCCIVQARVCSHTRYNEQKCNFHTTQKLCIPPIWSLFLHRLIHVGAILYGRSIRRWWMRKTEEEKAEYRQWFRERRNVFLGTLGLFLFAIISYCIAHTEKHPITKRRRLMLFNEQQKDTLNKYLLETFVGFSEHPVLAVNDPSYKRVARVLKRLKSANNDMESVKKTNWKIYIIDLPIMNAFILPGGAIFIFKRILDTIENDDQLGIVLAHEMAHEILEHAVEKLSELLIIDVFLIIPLIIVWTVFPNIIGGLIHFFGNRMIDIAYNVPYSKLLENEADSVGLTLAEKACIDLREGVVYWGRMRVLNELKIEEEPLPWFATHPSHSDREKKLNDQVTNMINTRHQFRCPNLNPLDPREKFYKQSYEEHIEYFKQKGII